MDSSVPSKPSRPPTEHPHRSAVVHGGDGGERDRRDRKPLVRLGALTVLMHRGGAPGDSLRYRRAAQLACVVACLLAVVSFWDVPPRKSCNDEQGPLVAENVKKATNWTFGPAIRGKSFRRCGRHRYNTISTLDFHSLATRWTGETPAVEIF